MLTRLRCPAAVALLAAAAAHAQTVTAIPNFNAKALSADGRVVAGDVGGFHSSGSPARWRRATNSVEPLPPPGESTKILGISGDGSILVGVCTVDHTLTPWYWSAQGGSTLMTIAGAPAGQATCISRDGRTIGGIAVPTGSFYHSFVWTQADGVRMIPEGTNYSTWLHALSSDGLSGVGSGSSASGQLGTRWGSTYVWCANMEPVEGIHGTTLMAATPDQRVFVGDATLPAANGRLPLIWIPPAAPQPLAALAPNNTQALTAVSDDGLVAGGYIGTATDLNAIGIIWTPATSLIRANAFFTARGINLGSAAILRVVGISANGRIFACTTAAGGLLIDLGPCNSADFNNDGSIGTDADIEAFFRCLAGSCRPTCDSADFNHDGDSGTDADIESFFRVLAGGHC